MDAISLDYYVDGYNMEYIKRYFLGSFSSALSMVKFAKIFLIIMSAIYVAFQVYKKYTQPFVSNAHTYTRDTHSEISLRISRDEQNNGSMHNHRRRCKRRNERRHFCQLRAGKQKMSKLRQTDETDKEQARKIFSGLRRLSRLP